MTHSLLLFLLLIGNFTFLEGTFIDGVALTHEDETVNDSTPASLAALIVGPVFQNPAAFFQWNYGCAIIVENLWGFADQFKMVELVPQLNQILDRLVTDPTQNGYKILHNIKIDFGAAVGDTVGLFPIAYLGRYYYYQNHPGVYDNTTDLLIIDKVINEYILPWPVTLADGTIARKSGWDGEPPGASFLWDDDQFMGLSLISQSVTADLYPISQASALITKYATMLLDWVSYGMTNPINQQGDLLFWHGVNAADRHHSCCQWGRGNGWIFMTYVEVLTALKSTGNGASPLYQKVLAIYQSHARGLKATQSNDGRWHQILNETGTFYETSCTAMFLWSMVEGIFGGYLPKAEFDPVVTLAWHGLVRAITSTGYVTGISEGTGVGPSVAWYDERPTNYLNSSPGLGSVLRAILAYDAYINQP